MEQEITTRQIFSKYISEKIPKKQTNIFWQLFNGIDAIFSHLELVLKIYKKERNFLTASNIFSLRNLASLNGFEPKLKIPSKGILYIKVNPKLFNRVGFPLYLHAYSNLICKATKLSYYYDSNKTLKIENDVLLIPVVEGQLIQRNEKSTGKYIERIYLNTDSIAENSINISVGTTNFTEVKSFFDNENLHDNKQFLVKYSNKTDTPLIIYIKGTKLNDIIDIKYRVTSGEFGNINYKTNFEADNLINSQGNLIELSDDEIEIYNISGFNFGSNGTDVNSLRAAIGFNHGVNLLFDFVSYRDYINKYSNILLQNIMLSENHKSINNIFISKKQYVNIEYKNMILQQYQQIINLKSYLFSDEDLSNFDNLLNENEFALSSHNLYHSKTNKFALQILFNNQLELERNLFDIKTLIYSEFSKFFYDKNFQLNFELLFNNFMEINNTFFEYTIFNEIIEKQKLIENKEISTPYIIKHDEYLPILNGDFNISDINNTPIKLFFDINAISKETLN